MNYESPWNWRERQRENFYRRNDIFSQGWREGNGLSGLGANDAAVAETAVNTGLNFVPGIGPALSAGASALESIATSLFGWGGPPLSSITGQLIPLRQHIADLRNALASVGLGAPDHWTLPNPDVTADYSLIDEEILNIPHNDQGFRTDGGKIDRSTDQSAITAMNQMITQLNTQLQAAEMQIQEGKIAVSTPATSVPSTPVPPPGNGYHLPPEPQGYDGVNGNYYKYGAGYNSVQNQTAPSPVPSTLSTIDWTPWLLLGGGGILLALFMKGGD